MDPDQALLDARAACDHWHNGERGDHDLDAFDELVNAFEALDQWLSKGGFLPHDWRNVTYRAANNEQLPVGAAGTTVVNDGRPT